METKIQWKYLHLFCGSLLILEPCSGQTLDCKEYKNGTFQIFDESIGTTLINRNGNIQSEIPEGGKDTVFFYVNWISDCIYTLKPTEFTRNKYPQLPIDAELQVNIVEIKLNSYIQTTSSNFSDIRLTKEVVRIQKY